MFGASSELAPNMLVASSEPASVMELGFNTPCSDSRCTCLLNVRSALFNYFTKKMALRDLLMIALVLGARSSASIEVDTVSGSRVFYPRDSLLDCYICYCPVSVCPSVTSRCSIETAGQIELESFDAWTSLD